MKLFAAILPLFPALVFFSILLGQPLLWLAWTATILPWVIYCVLIRGLPAPTPFAIPIALLVIGLAVGYAVSPDRSMSLEAVQTTLACILIYYGVTLNFEQKRVFWWVLTAICGIVIVGILLAYFAQSDPQNARRLVFNQWLFNLVPPAAKVFGVAIHVNLVGVFLAVAVPILIAFGLFARGRGIKLAGLASGIVLLAVLVLSGSGTGWLGGACGLLFIIFVWRPLLGGISAVATLAFGGFLALSYHNYSWPAQVFSTNSLHGRFDLWQSTLDFLKDSPFSGIGLGAWPQVYQSQTGAYQVNVHNSYLQLWADTGLAGILAAIAALIIFFFIARRVLGSERKGDWNAAGAGLVGAVIAGAVASLFELSYAGVFMSNGYHYVGIPLIWVCAALLVVGYYHLRARARQGE